MSNCACICTDASDCSNLELRLEIRKARKQHKCGECGKVIETGEKYEYYAGKSDGDFFTAKTCLGCAIIRDNLFCEGWFFWGIWSDIYENIEDIEANCFSELVLKLPEYTKEKLNNVILENKKNNPDRYCICEECLPVGECTEIIKNSAMCQCKQCEVFEFCRGGE